MSVVRIFVSCNKTSYVPDHPLLFPVQTGADLNDTLFAGMQQDNTGINISKKNNSYCELTTQYWAWKNTDSDYYGFFHNRRYLSFGSNRLPEDVYGNVHLDMINDQALSALGLTTDNIKAAINNYDIITVEPLDMKKITPPPFKPTIYNQYILSAQHHKEDLDLAIKIVSEKYPDYVEALNEYMASSEGYFLNMFIMAKEYFHEYCNWLFDILDEFDSRQDFSNCSVYEQRKTALIAERLFGVYLTHIKSQQRDLRILHCQRSLFSSQADPYPVPLGGDASLAIAMVSSNEYVPYLGVLLQSISDNANANRFYDIIVLSNGISAENRQLLSLELHEKSNLSLRFVEIRAYFTDKALPTRDHISVASYGRLLLPDILRKYDKVLYLDSDIVVNADPALLFDTAVDDYLIAAVRDTLVASWYNIPGHEIIRNLDDILKLSNPYDYFNAGVMVVNLIKFRSLFSSRELFDIAVSRKWLWMDQDILNFLCAKSVKFVDQSWNVMAHIQANTAEHDERFAPKWLQDSYLAAHISPKAIHYAGETLPRCAFMPDLYWYFWKYARRSLFHELFIQMMTAKAHKDNYAGFHYNPWTNTKKKTSFGRKALKYIINLFLPLGTQRRRKAIELFIKVKGHT